MRYPHLLVFLSEKLILTYEQTMEHGSRITEPRLIEPRMIEPRMIEPRYD